MGFGMFDWSAGDLGSAMLESLTNWIAGEERQPGVDPAAVQNKYNQQRDGVRTPPMASASTATTGRVR